MPLNPSLNPRRLRACSSGLELIGRDFTEDVEHAADLDASSTVPVLDGEAYGRAGSEA